MKFISESATGVCEATRSNGHTAVVEVTSVSLVVDEALRIDAYFDGHSGYFFPHVEGYGDSETIVVAEGLEIESTRKVDYQWSAVGPVGLKVTQEQQALFDVATALLTVPASELDYLQGFNADGYRVRSFEAKF